MDIGFLDLAALAGSVAACADWGESETSSAPVRWVGFEASTSAVAKTLAVAQMMAQGAPVESVVQVGRLCGRQC